MSNIGDNGDDWSNHSASLFRGARRAHDPTPSERARLDAVLARIQAGTAIANDPPKVALRKGEATYALLRQVAKLSLAVACAIVATLVITRANRQPAGSTSRAQRPPSTVTSSPPLVEVLPAPVPSAEGSGSSRHSPLARDAESRSRSPRRRTRVDVGSQRRSATHAATVPEVSLSASGDASTSVFAPPNGATQNIRSEPQPAAIAVASTSGAAKRATSVESNAQQTVTAAREADPTVSPAARTELALLKRMQAALRGADFSTALALCAEHQRRWPQGTFEQEREGVRAIASCGANTDEATSRAKRFLAAHPHAPVAMRVSSACAVQLLER